MADNEKNPKVLTETDRRRILKDMAPSVEQQSMGFVQWGQMGGFLGQPFDSTAIPLSKLRQMRRDPMISFGLQYVKLPLIRAPWFIECENAQIAQFVTEALGLIYERLMMQVSLKYDFGFQAIVKNFIQQPVDWTYTNKKDSNNPTTAKVWTSTVDPIIWKPFTTIPPEHVIPEWTDDGEFDGFNKFGVGGGLPGVKTNFENKVDINHALWVTNEKDSKHGSIWGYPRIGYAYRYWWSYWYGWALRDRYMERSSDPSVIVRYPDQRINDATGQPINTRVIAEGLGQNIRAGQTVALPNSLVADAEGKKTGTPEWDISYLEHKGSTAQEFQQLFDYLDVMKLRSIMVPEQALINGGGAQSNRNVAEQLADIFTESQATEMVEFGDLVNRYMIPQLVAINFPDYKGYVRWKSRGFSSADRQLVMQMLTLIGQDDPNSLEIDTREIMEQMQIPVKDPEQLAIEKQQAMAEQEQQLAMQAKYAPTPAAPAAPASFSSSSSPGPAPKPKGGQYGPQNTDWQQFQFGELEPIPGVRAGIDEHGQYYDPPERIVLSRYPLGPFAKKVKDLRYFKGDDEALQAAHDLYEIWSDAFKDYYEMIVKHFAKITLADEPNPDDTIAHMLEQTVAKAIKIFNKALGKSLGAYSTLAGSAAKKEMNELHFDIDWKMDNPEVRAWMRDHGAALVRNVTDSTRKEVARFIAKELKTDKTPLEISKAIDENFSQWPDWKAERLSRSEARDAYNAGTLLAAQQNGITHVQASDASGGRNLHTDKECIERNGQIFTTQQAFHIIDHPNGTLVWRPIPAGLTLSIERHSPVEGPLAAFDEETGVIHLSETITPEQESDFLLAVVDSLKKP